MLSNHDLAILLEQRKGLRQQVSPEEWAARVELAACYWLIAHFRMTDWIYNHQFKNDYKFLQGRDWQALLRLLDRIDPSYKE